MQTRQNTWATSTFQRNALMNSMGSSHSNCYDPTVRRYTYPLDDTYRHPLVPCSSSATLLDTAVKASNTSPFYYLAGRPATISSATTTTQQSMHPATFLPKLTIPMTPQLPLWSVRSPPVFHAQSLMFVFGFLFFPCWWIGAFYIGNSSSVKKHVSNPGSTLPRYHSSHTCICRLFHQTMATEIADPPILINDRVTTPCTLVCASDGGKGEEEQEYSEEATALIWEERERAMFREWNRWMSFVSVGMIGFIAAMLVWYHVGSRSS
ncbi:hypothetical protein BX666DRAFT_1908054, partial [Dichotomocladium elegans]